MLLVLPLLPGSLFLLCPLPCLCPTSFVFGFMFYFGRFTAEENSEMRKGPHLKNWCEGIPSRPWTGRVGYILLPDGINFRVKLFLLFNLKFCRNTNFFCGRRQLAFASGHRTLRLTCASAESNRHRYSVRDVKNVALPTTPQGRLNPAATLRHWRSHWAGLQVTVNPWVHA